MIRHWSTRARAANAVARSGPERGPFPRPGDRLRSELLDSGELVARWTHTRRDGHRPEMLAAVLDSHQARRLVIAERTSPNGWTTRHVLTPTGEAIGMLRRQGTQP